MSDNDFDLEPQRDGDLKRDKKPVKKDDGLPKRPADATVLM
jgi:hypothetical protein